MGTRRYAVAVRAAIARHVTANSENNDNDEFFFWRTSHFGNAIIKTGRS
jgi:hypothetical protein